jgi:hypothetical protein
MPCEHMVCVAKHRFPDLGNIGFTIEGSNQPCAYMLQDFNNWVIRCGLIFQNYVYNGDDMQYLTPQCGVSLAEFVPNIEECLSRVDASMSLKMPPVLEQNKATKQLKRYRSQGEVSGGSSVAAPRPAPVDLQAQAAQQLLLTDIAVVGKRFMVVYTSLNSKATFQDKDHTLVKANPCRDDPCIWPHGMVKCSASLHKPHTNW